MIQSWRQDEFFYQSEASNEDIQPFLRTKDICFFCSGWQPKIGILIVVPIRDTVRTYTFWLWCFVRYASSEMFGSVDVKTSETHRLISIVTESICTLCTEFWGFASSLFTPLNSAQLTELNLYLVSHVFALFILFWTSATKKGHRLFFAINPKLLVETTQPLSIQ